MDILLKISKIIDNISERAGTISTALVLITVAVGFYNVVARYIGRYIGIQLSSNFFIELQWYLYSLTFFFGFTYLLKNDGNVRVDFIYSNWPIKRKAWLNLVGHILFLLPLCLIGIYATINPVMSSWGRLPNGDWGTWEVSPDPGGLPRAPIKSMIIVAFMLLLFQTFSELIKLAAILKGHKELKTVIEHDKEKERPAE